MNLIEEIFNAIRNKTLNSLGAERNLMKLIQDNTVNILGWIQYEKVKWLQNNNPDIE